MIAYSPAKINIGLRILNKREDGYHNLHSYFYPVPLYDLLEIRESDTDELVQTGLISTSLMEDNLVYKALVLLRNLFDIPPLKIHLHKQIPFQAGLGGGSGNAISFIKLLLNQFQYSLNQAQWKEISEKLGSDCPFFIQAVPSEISGRGEIVKPIPWKLKGIGITIVKPDISIKTSDAFSNITTNDQLFSDIKTTKFTDYQKKFENQFEASIFSKYPYLFEIKEELIRSGAFYSSLSGSGSAVFGLFYKAVRIHLPSSYFVWNGILQ